jgi:hypothetical protein
MINSQFAKVNNNDNNNVEDLEKNIIIKSIIFKGSHSLYLDSIFKKMYLSNIQNTKIFYNFLISEHNGQNVRLNTTLTYIKILSLFSDYSQYKDFKKITKDDIIGFLNSSRKNEQDDPNHKWIGTYNTRHSVLNKFFRWIYNFYENNETDQKKWITPQCMQGVKHFTRKEKSTYKPSDIWTDEDHALFLKYCPDKNKVRFLRN